MPTSIVRLRRPRTSWGGIHMNSGPPYIPRLVPTQAGKEPASRGPASSGLRADASCRCFSGYIPVSADAAGNRAFRATTRLEIWFPVWTRVRGPRPAFVCLDSPSLAERPRLCRSASGRAAAAKLSPCAVCPPATPSRCATASSSLVVGSRTNQRPANRRSSRSARASRDAPLRSSPSRYRNRSRDEGPDGSLRAFARDDVGAPPPQPLSAPLQAGIRFLRLPLPAAPSAFLTVHLPIHG